MACPCCGKKCFCWKWTAVSLMIQVNDYGVIRLSGTIYVQNCGKEGYWANKVLAGNKVDGTYITDSIQLYWDMIDGDDGRGHINCPITYELLANDIIIRGTLNMPCPPNWSEWAIEYFQQYHTEALSYNCCGENKDCYGKECCQTLSFEIHTNCNPIGTLGVDQHGDEISTYCGGSEEWTLDANANPSDCHVIIQGECEDCGCSPLSQARFTLGTCIEADGSTCTPTRADITFYSIDVMETAGGTWKSVSISGNTASMMPNNYGSYEDAIVTIWKSGGQYYATVDNNNQALPPAASAAGCWGMWAFRPDGSNQIYDCTNGCYGAANTVNMCVDLEAEPIGGTLLPNTSFMSGTSQGTCGMQDCVIYTA